MSGLTGLGGLPAGCPFEPKQCSPRQSQKHRPISEVQAKQRQDTSVGTRYKFTKVAVIAGWTRRSNELHAGA